MDHTHGGLLLPPDESESDPKCFLDAKKSKAEEFKTKTEGIQTKAEGGKATAILISL